MDDVIAERELTYRERGTDVDDTVIVRLGRPRGAEHAPAYTIPFEIVGPEGYVISKYVVGEDSMQALSLVYGVVHALLDAIKRDGELTWLGSADLGIPTGQ